MPKIIYFDYWTKGINNFSSIDKVLQEQGFDTLLLHIGSDTEKNKEKEEVIAGITCRDITYYNTRSLVKIFLREKADAVITLNTERPFDRIVILSARAVGIPIVYMMHGQHYLTRSDQSTTLKKMYAKRNSLIGKLSQFRRFIRFSKDYLRAVSAYNIKDLSDTQVWKYLFGLVFDTANTIHNPRVNSQMHADRALLYSNAYISYYTNDIGYPMERIKVVGNPILDNLPNMTSTETSPFEGPFVTYIDDGAVEAGLEGWTIDSRIDFYKKIAISCRNAGYSLLIRPHPRTDIMSLKPLEGHNSLKVRRASLLNDDIIGSSAVIGHTSSALMLAVRLGKPILLAKFDIGKNIFDYFYEREGAAMPCHSAEDLTNKLRAIKSGSRLETLDEFWENFIEPADGNSALRISEELLRVIHNQKTKV